MTDASQVQKLAALARISVPDASLPRLVSEFDEILAYVGQLDSLSLPAGASAVPPLRNIFRVDGEPNEPGIYTENIAEQFPARNKNALSVKQIISHD